MVVASTPRMTLRRLTEADAAFYCRLANDPDWLRNIGNRNVPTPEAAAEFIRGKTLPGYEALGFGMYLVESKADGTPLGLAGLVKRDTLPGPDIGFAFLAEYRGQGYALEAARAVVDYARTLGMTRLLEKLGFVLEGLKPVGQQGEELLVYAIDV